MEDPPMAIRTIAVWLLLASIVGFTGCSAVGSTKKFFSALKPPEEHVPADDPQEDWDFVGEEARKHRPTEKDPDPWWQMHVMSPRARAIERSLGVE
jgi:hypothetical protein